MKTKIELITERLILRPVKEKDAKAIFSYRSDSFTNQYQGWIPKSLEDVHEFINKVSPEFDVVDTWFQFVIIRNNSNEIIGDVGIHFLDADKKQVEIGCTIDKKYQEKGYATEALRQIIDYLFSKFNKHRIITSLDPGNSNSIKLVERLGFRKEAHFKESILINGEWVDDLVYAILNKEWKFL
ncbi:MAG: N-acetyltransferase [Bacteroidetes bacterium]|nr:MAG: N-acetyltransferase [Bacteroidota bacterium]